MKLLNLGSGNNMFFLKNLFKNKPSADKTKFQNDNPPKSHIETEEDMSKPNTQMNEEEHFRPDYIPECINRRFIYDNQKYLNENNLATDFSEAVITSLFGFDKNILEKCLLFSESQTVAIGSAFSHLWDAIFRIHNKNTFVNNEEMAYNSVFNYQTGKVLVQKAKQLVVRKKVYGNTAEIVFKSCMPTQGFPNFEGYADFDFITALSILLIKEDYPDIQMVKANVYFRGGIYLDNLDFSVKVESTLDQRYIYGLINSR